MSTVNRGAGASILPVMEALEPRLLLSAAFGQELPPSFTVAGAQLPSVAIDDAEVLEGAADETTEISFRVWLSEASAVPVTVRYTTLGGTAREGIDYAPTSGELAFEPGQIEALVKVPVWGNNRFQDDRSFLVSLFDVSNAAIADSSATGTILDDDVPVVVPVGAGGAKSVIYKDEDGTTVRITLQSGSGFVLFPEGDVQTGPNGATVIGNELYVHALYLTQSSIQTTLAFWVSGGDGRATVRNITVNGDLGRLDGRGMFLLGDIQVSGGLGNLQLGGTLGPQSGISIGPAATAKQTTTLNLGNVTDLSIISGTPIQSLTVVSWVDEDKVADVIVASWIGTLKATGKAANVALGIPTISGDFGASLTLTGMGAPRGIALNSTVVVGDISGTKWDITGNVGTIDIWGNVTGWKLDMPSSIRTLKLGDVTDTAISVNGSIGSVQVVRWKSGSLSAASVGTLKATGKAGNATLGIPAIAGDFETSLTLTGMGAPRGIALNSATVVGGVSGTTWDITGNVGTIDIRGNVSGWTLDVHSSVQTLKLGDVGDTTVAVNGPIGSVQAIRWQSGSLAAGSVGTLKTTGKAGNAKLGIPAIAGNWGADVTLSGVGAVRETLRQAEIAGEANGTWRIVGYGNSIRVGSSAAAWDVTYTGDLKTLTGTNTLSGRFEANSIGAVSAKSIANAEFVLHQVPNTTRLALNSITPKEWMTRTRILSAGNIGNVTAAGMENSSIFAGVLATRDMNSDGVLDLPDSAADLDLTPEGRAEIRNVRANGMRGADGKYVDSFINTNLAAGKFGNVLVSYVRTHNSGVPFGIAADHIQRLSTRDNEGTDVYGPLSLAGDSGAWADAKVRVF